MYTLNLILDICLLFLMIFRLLGQSILLFTATDIIKQCPCTSASIIFFSSLLTNFSPNSRQVFQLLIFFSCACHRIRHQHGVLSDCSFVPHSNLLTAITDSRLWLLLAMLLLHGFLGPFPGCFFRSSLKFSPLIATRNLCRPRFVTTLDMMHCLLSKIIDNS